MDCEGYKSLLADVKKEEGRDQKDSRYRVKFHWVLARARHYADKTGLAAEEILDAWERCRRYWYMNYYQECKQPEIKDGHVRVFDTVEELQEAVGDSGFRCPHCNGVSTSAYECDSGVELDGKKCDWKVYGLFGHCGNGISVFVKEKVAVQAIFMPLAWEGETA